MKEIKKMNDKELEKEIMPWFNQWAKDEDADLLEYFKSIFIEGLEQSEDKINKLKTGGIVLNDIIEYQKKQLANQKKKELDFLRFIEDKGLSEFNKEQIKWRIEKISEKDGVGK